MLAIDHLNEDQLRWGQVVGWPLALLPRVEVESTSHCEPPEGVPPSHICQGSSEGWHWASASQASLRFAKRKRKRSRLISCLRPCRPTFILEAGRLN